jgi:magnesium transporter
MKKGRKHATPPPKARAVAPGMFARSAGLPPGSPVYIGERDPTASTLSLYSYDEAGWKADFPATTATLLDLLDAGKISWVNVNGLSGGVVERLCEKLGVHPLVVEDILNTQQRPRVENYDSMLFIVTKMLSLRPDTSIEYEQVSILVQGRLVVTIQESPGDCFGPIRERIATGAGRLRRSGPDYLAYALFDVIIDNYFHVLEEVGDRLDRFEMQAMDPGEARTFMAGLQELKAELLHLRRVVWPVRDSVGALARLDSKLLSPDLQPFLRDLYENTVQALEAIESYREHAASILEVYLSSVSNRMNEIMKVLTVISTIFIPLTFLAGVYGMNFHYMPELAKPWAYPALWGVMVTISVGMLVFFKRKKWF